MLTNITRLTLSADRQLIAEAKRMAAARKTSVSAMFVRFLVALKQQEIGAPMGLGAITREAAGLIRLPARKSTKRLLEQALADKYRGSA